MKGTFLIRKMSEADRDRVKAAAAMERVSMNKWIQRAILERLERLEGE